VIACLDYRESIQLLKSSLIAKKAALVPTRSVLKENSLVSPSTVSSKKKLKINTENNSASLNSGFVLTKNGIKKPFRLTPKAKHKKQF
jgi:hypothetical protein